MDTWRPHVLVVDDSEDDQMMYAYYLTRQGYHVSEAYDGIEGLEKAFRLAPDLILLDLCLPKMSGWDVIQRLKADERAKNIPVLVVTGHTMVCPRECDGFLTKPCSPDEVGAEIADRLSALVSKSPPARIV